MFTAWMEDKFIATSYYTEKTESLKVDLSFIQPLH